MVNIPDGAVVLSRQQLHQQRWARVSACVRRMDNVVLDAVTEFGFLGITKRWWLDAKKRLQKTSICCSPHNWTRPPFPQVYYSLWYLLSYYIYLSNNHHIIIIYYVFVRCVNYNFYYNVDCRAKEFQFS